MLRSTFGALSPFRIATRQALTLAQAAAASSSPAGPIKTGQTPVADLTPLKFDSNGSRDLYAICKIHNMPYLVTKGDRIVLPYRIRNHNVGDVLNLDTVTTLGLRNFTFNNDKGIPQAAFSLTATLAEITREPKYNVYKKRPRNRRLKTVEVEPFQTHLVISELKLN